METLQPTKEAVLQAYENANKNGKQLLVDLYGKNTFVKNIRERLQNWADILEYHGHTQESFDEWCKGLRIHEVGQREEEMIVAAYNQRQLNDPLPIWGDGTGVKRYPIFRMPASGSRFSFHGRDYWHSTSYVGARLVFFGDESLDNLKDAVEKFLPQYEKSRTL